VAIEHLTDPQIQDYLDGNVAPEQRETLREHIDQCERCRSILTSYQNLYFHLEDDRDVALPRNFTKNVLAVLKKESVGEVHLKLTNVFLIGFGVIVALNTVFYFYDFGALFDRLKQNIDLNPEYITALKPQAYNLEANIYILTFAVMLLLAAADYFFFRPRQRTH
jgi:predicted anti-sigma-YlaC factor YlaD